MAQGYDILIFDSMSHAWHGALDQVDQIAARGPRGDKFGAWSTVTPQYREMIQTLTDPRAHVIATMRVKSEYENFEENGKRKIRKVGTKTDQRENTEYEFDLVLRLEAGNEAMILWCEFPAISRNDQDIVQPKALAATRNARRMAEDKQIAEALARDQFNHQRQCGPDPNPTPYRLPSHQTTS